MNLVNVWIVDKDEESRKAHIKEVERTKDMFCGVDFSSCKEVVAKCDSSDSFSKPNVILIDITSIDKSNISLLRANLPDCAFIFITPTFAENVILEAMRFGPESVISKGINLERLLQTIREVNRGVVIYPAEVAATILNKFRRLQTETPFELTEREIENLRELGKGYTQKEIASRLKISHHTVNSHLQRVYEKLGVRSGLEAVVKALREEII